MYPGSTKANPRTSDIYTSGWLVRLISITPWAQLGLEGSGRFIWDTKYIYWSHFRLGKLLYELVAVSPSKQTSPQGSFKFIELWEKVITEPHIGQLLFIAVPGASKRRCIRNAE